MGPRHHLDRAGVRAVARHRPQLVRIGAHHVRQHVRVTSVALRPGHAVALPVAGGLQRVHRRTPCTRPRPGGHPRATVCLDPDHHLRIVRVLAELLPDQDVQPGHPCHALRQPPAGQHPALLVHQLHVVMILSPVIPHEQPHKFSRPKSRIWPAACGRTISALMKQCSRPSGRARHPSSDQLSRPPARARSSVRLKAREQKVLTCRSYQAPSLPDGDSLTLIRSKRWQLSWQTRHLVESSPAGDRVSRPGGDRSRTTSTPGSFDALCGGTRGESQEATLTPWPT